MSLFLLLAGAYLIGYCLASILFAQVSDRFRPLKLMCVALLVWCLACVGSGFSFTFAEMCAARTFTGVGEAAFMILAPVR